MKTQWIVAAGIAGALLLVGVVAAIDGRSEDRQSHLHEVQSNLRAIRASSVAYFADHERFPRSSPMTPAVEHMAAACEMDTPMVTSGWSNNAAWAALGFEIADPHRFSFQYDSQGTGESAQFTASAFADLDCDGVLSTFVAFGTVQGGRALAPNGEYMRNTWE